MSQEWEPEKFYFAIVEIEKKMKSSFASYLTLLGLGCFIGVIGCNRDPVSKTLTLAAYPNQGATTPLSLQVNGINEDAEVSVEPDEKLNVVFRFKQNEETSGDTIFASISIPYRETDTSLEGSHVMGNQVAIPCSGTVGEKTVKFEIDGPDQLLRELAADNFGPFFYLTIRGIDGHEIGSRKILLSLP